MVLKEGWEFDFFATWEDQKSNLWTWAWSYLEWISVDKAVALLDLTLIQVLISVKGNVKNVVVSLWIKKINRFRWLFDEFNWFLVQLVPFKPKFFKNRCKLTVKKLYWRQMSFRTSPVGPCWFLNCQRQHTNYRMIYIYGHVNSGNVLLLRSWCYCHVVMTGWPINPKILAPPLTTLLLCRWNLLESRCSGSFISFNQYPLS